MGLRPTAEAEIGDSPDRRLQQVRGPATGWSAASEADGLGNRAESASFSCSTWAQRLEQHDLVPVQDRL